MPAVASSLAGLTTPASAARVNSNVRPHISTAMQSPMQRTPPSLVVGAAALLLSACAATSTPQQQTAPSVTPSAKSLSLVQPQGLEFQVHQLSGSWAETSGTAPICTNNEIRYRFEFTQDPTKLTIRLNRLHPTEIGELDKINAIITASTASTLTFQYQGETRRREDGKLLEWQLVLVSPGIYRWRETSWPPQGVNVVVGVKCSA